MEKSDDNPMQRPATPLQQAKRCSAKSKRTGQPCRSPAVNGWAVCRMHGAGGGAPEGQRNGNYRHGDRTKRTLAALMAVRVLGRLCQQTLDDLPD